MHKKRFDIVVLLIFLILAPILSFYLKTNLLISIFLFYGLPSIYLSFKVPCCIIRAAIFSFIATVLFLMVDYIAVMDGAWWVSSIFDYRFFDILPIEDSIWFFMAAYLLALFYEYFEDGSKQPKKNRLMRFVETVSLLATVFVLILIFYPNLLVISYAYLWIGIFISLGPAMLVLLKYPDLRTKFLKTNLYFVLLHLPFEIVALKLGQWNFPGKNFIGWVEIMNVRFPIEELVIYVLMTGIAGLAYYEYFADDGK